MTDLLVRLYDLPPHQLPPGGVRRAMAYEKEQVLAWVRDLFGPGWAGECAVAFCRQPLACHIATSQGLLLGFACYDSLAPGVFGPVGVAPQARGRGLGTALTLACLEAMASLGYLYAVVGGAGSNAEFYRRRLGAWDIPETSPGPYRDRLSPDLPTQPPGPNAD